MTASIMLINLHHPETLRILFTKPALVPNLNQFRRCLYSERCTIT